jgi:hypothetical protein
MTQIESVALTAQSTFGRDGAMFESLLGFVAQLSVVLWILVTLTAVIRFVGIRIYRRGAARAARVETVAPIAAVSAAVVQTTTAGIDLVQPAASQLADTGLVRLGLVGSTAADKDSVLVPAELVDSKGVDVMKADAITNPMFDDVLQPAEAPAAVAASVKVPRHALRNRRAEHRSAAHMPALAAKSTES